MRSIIVLKWDRVERILGRPYAGTDDDADLIDFIGKDESVREWALNADIHTDDYGWALIGPVGGAS